MGKKNKQKKEDEIRALLKEIIDPEMGISIVDLGLVRRIRLNSGGEQVDIELTVTSPGCPVAGELMQLVAYQAAKADGVEQVDVDISIDPPWDPRVEATEEGKLELGIW